MNTEQLNALYLSAMCMWQNNQTNAAFTLFRLAEGNGGPAIENQYHRARCKELMAHLLRD